MEAGRGTTMRAAVTIGFGGPEMLEVRDNVPVPDAGPGEALVEVGACCCNNSDLWLREGAYGREDEPDARAGWRREAQPVSFPLIQGSGTVGRVAAVGEGADERLLGQRVLVEHTLHSDAAPNRTASPESSVGNGTTGSPTTSASRWRTWA